MPHEGRILDEVTLARGWIEWLGETTSGYAEALLGPPEPERKKDRGASFPSLEDIYLHILDDNVWWLGSVPQRRQESHRTVEGPLTPE